LRPILVQGHPDTLLASAVAGCLPERRVCRQMDAASSPQRGGFRHRHLLRWHGALDPRTERASEPRTLPDAHEARMLMVWARIAALVGNCGHP
jgi:hypothetical protein